LAPTCHNPVGNLKLHDPDVDESEIPFEDMIRYKLLYIFFKQYRIDPRKRSNKFIYLV
jgi:hypothetical protein